MWLNKAALVCFTVGSLAFGQVAAPRPPRGHSAVTRVVTKRAYLGVGVVELTPERAKTLKLGDATGVEVRRVDENSPASKAGVKENDVILEVNGQKLEDVEQFIETIGDSSPGSKVAMTISRDGARQSLSATLQSKTVQPFIAELPEVPVIPEVPNGVWGPVFTGQSPRVGLEGETLTPQLAEYFGVREGVLVRSVTARTPAERAGLKAGDVIIKVAGTPVSSAREISGLVRNSHKVTFTVVRNRKEITLNVEIASSRQQAGPFREVL